MTPEKEHPIPSTDEIVTSQTDDEEVLGKITINIKYEGSEST